MTHTLTDSKKKVQFWFFYFRLILEDTHVNQELDLVLLEVAADLGRQEDARTGAEFTVLLVQFSLKHKLLEVDESHGHRRLLVAALILRQLSYLPFQAAGNWRDERERRKVELPSQIISTCSFFFFFCYLLILLSVSLIWGNFSLKVSFMSFLRSEGLTYSMTVVWKERPKHKRWRHGHAFSAERGDWIPPTHKCWVAPPQREASHASPTAGVRWSTKCRTKGKAKQELFSIYNNRKQFLQFFFLSQFGGVLEYLLRTGLRHTRVQAAWVRWGHYNWRPSVWTTNKVPSTSSAWSVSVFPDGAMSEEQVDLWKHFYFYQKSGHKSFYLQRPFQTWTIVKNKQTKQIKMERETNEKHRAISTTLCVINTWWFQRVHGLNSKYAAFYSIFMFSYGFILNPAVKVKVKLVWASLNGCFCWRGKSWTGITIMQNKTSVFHLHMMEFINVTSGSLLGKCEPTTFTLRYLTFSLLLTIPF